MKNQKRILNVQGTPIGLISEQGEEFISLTDVAKYRNEDEPYSVINNWMRSRSTISFLGLWEKLNNTNFKPIEFERFKIDAGSNYFVLSPLRWIRTTHAIGIISKSGRYGGTFSHKDIAFEFASWISPEFKLYLIMEFQRLKEDENARLSQHWNLNRTLSKINYRIQTDAIRETLIPKLLNKSQVHFVYASEADLLNMALFGMTAKEWRVANPDAEGNIRDMATIEQLVVLSNMESINALLIAQGHLQSERLEQLNFVAITQMKSLLSNKGALNIGPKSSA